MLRRPIGLGLLIGGLIFGSAPVSANSDGVNVRKVVAMFTPVEDCEGLAGKFPRYALRRTTLPLPESGITYQVGLRKAFFSKDEFPSELDFDFNVPEFRRTDRGHILIYEGDLSSNPPRSQREKIDAVRDIFTVERCNDGISPERR